MKPIDSQNCIIMFLITAWWRATFDVPIFGAVIAMTTAIKVCRMPRKRVIFEIADCLQSEALQSMSLGTRSFMMRHGHPSHTAVD